MSLRIAHISDVHISSPTPPSIPSLGTLRRKNTSLLNKRLPSLIAERITRGPNVFSSDVFTAALQDMKKQNVDHLIVSGDLTNFSYTAEFEQVYQLLSPHFGPDECSIVPGNHDAFLRETVRQRRFTKHLGQYSTSNIPPVPPDDDDDVVGEHTSWEPGFPFIRIIEQNIAIIGLNSAVAHRLPLNSAGAIDHIQFTTAKKHVLNLQATKPQLYKIFVVHHPPRYGNKTIKDLRHDMQASSVQKCWQLFDLAGSKSMVIHGHDHDPYQGRLENRQRTLIFDSGSGTFVEGDRDHIARYNIYKFEKETNSLKSAIARVWSNDEKCFHTQHLRIPRRSKSSSIDGSLSISLH